jgi:hypothetical protein
METLQKYHLNYRPSLKQNVSYYLNGLYPNPKRFLSQEDPTSNIASKSF